MTPTRYELWENAPEGGDYAPYILHYKPENVTTDSTVFLVPGSGYRANPAIPVQEGERVAEYLCEQGIQVFVLIYRVGEDCYPSPLLDGRRGMRWLRYHAAEFGVAKDKIISLGYSAGGHLCASLVSFHKPMSGEGIDEIDEENYIPNYQALCYPVISFDTTKKYTHKGSVVSLLGSENAELVPDMCFERTAEAPVPPTFLFHNFDDASVGVENTLLYACKLRELGTQVEMHIYPHGGHGVGLAIDDKPSSLHNKDWLPRFVQWLRYNNLLG